MTAGRRPPPPRPRIRLDRSLLHHTGFRALAWQVLILVLVIASIVAMLGNAQQALETRGVETGFDFLLREAGFPIGEGLLPYQSSDSYLRAFAAALVNTLTVSAVSAVAATVLGLAIGLARLSTNWFVARFATAYVELFRNTPQLVQLSFWYLLATQLPGPRQAWNLADSAFVSNRGLLLPAPLAHPAHGWMLLAFVAGAAMAWFLGRRVAAARRATGDKPRVASLVAVLLLLPPLVVWLGFGAPHGISTPRLAGFNFAGGVAISPEFLVLFLGLSLYIAAFIAEIVRSGIQSVGRGQLEAARSIGLTRTQLQRRIVLPQALRVMIPPATSQYVSLVKNSSLGVAIGYPELFSITNTATTLSGQTIECMVLMAACYLTIAATVSMAMNGFNHLARIQER